MASAVALGTPHETAAAGLAAGIGGDAERIRRRGKKAWAVATARRAIVFLFPASRRHS
jgi:hypothetical protein